MISIQFESGDRSLLQAGPPKEIGGHQYRAYACVEVIRRDVAAVAVHVRPESLGAVEAFAEELLKAVAYMREHRHQQGARATDASL